MTDKLKIIDRYIGTSTLRGFCLAIFLLVAVFSIFELLVQLDSVGRGTYRVADAFIFTALTIPKRLVNLIPMAGLLGGILAIGLLADHQEITAMRAAGLAVQRIALTVLATTVLLMLVGVIVAELIAPPLERYARSRRFQAICGKSIMLTKQGFWTRNHERFVYVGHAFAGGGANIEIFEFDEKDELRQFIYAKQGALQGGNVWLFRDAEATVFNGNDITQKTIPEYRIEDFLSFSEVAVLALPADSLSLSDLYVYIRVLEQRGQNAERYELAFWQKLFLPVSTGAMVLLSLTFVFGPTRMRNAWQRIFVGMLAGTVFYLTNQILGQLSLVFHLPPLLMTALPSAIILLLGFRLLRRAF
jgi:lipopolysaccharide export system permease protein